MKIICCIRQTPDTETAIKIGEDNKAIQTNGIKWILGPYDEYSMEAACQLREKEGCTELTALTLAPAQGSEALRTCLAMGADKAVHINTAGQETDDALVVASALANQIQKMEYDFIFTSTKGSDSDRGAIGPMLAEMLGVAYVGLASEIKVEGDTLHVVRNIEGGAKEHFTVNSPAIVCCEQGVRGQPRYPSLMQIMKAKRKPIEEVGFADLGVDVEALSLVEIEKMEYPPERPPGQIVEGDSVEQKVEKLLELLKSEAKVLD